MKRNAKKWMAAIGVLAVVGAAAWVGLRRQPVADRSVAIPAAVDPAPLLDWRPHVGALAGDGHVGWRDGAGAQAQFDGPMGLAIDHAGRVIVADAYNDRIRAITPDGQVTTLAGGALPGDADGQGANARFDTPCAVLVDTQGRLVVADTRNDALRAIDAAGNVTTIASVAPGDTEKILRRPVSLALTKEGHLVVGTLVGVVAEVASDGTAHPVFGVHEHGFVRPTGLAMGASRRLLVADSASSRLHAVVPRGASAADASIDGALGPAPDRPLPAAGGRWPVRPQLAWHEVVGTIGEDRGDGKSESRDHFHDGLDVRGDVGQDVVAIAAGKVSNPLSTHAFGQINEGLSIGSLAYVHMRVGRDARGAALDPARFVPVHDEAGRLVRMRVRRGTRFAAGEVLGSINQRAHVHLWMGVSGYGLNPLLLGLHDFHDTVAPSIGSIEIRGASDQRLAQRQAGRLLLPRGALSLVVDAWDQVDGNLPRRRLGLYSLGVQWLHADGTPLAGFERPRTAIEFARLPGDELVKEFYADRSGVTVQGNSETHFRYQVGHPQDQAAADPISTAALPVGDYILRVVAKDFSGNEALRGRDVAVRVY